MMRIAAGFRPFIVLLAVSLFPLHASFCEVGVDLDESNAVVGLSLMRGGDGSDPWPWGRVRTHVDDSWLLNTGGDQGPFPDGEPSLGWDPVGGTPEVTWARHDGQDYEIVISRWETDHWTSPATLTANAVDDLDPEIAYAPDGTARLTFWSGSDVFMLTRSPGGNWSLPEAVDTGERSSVAGTATERVAYQRDPVEQPSEIVAAERVGGWVPVILTTASFAGFDGDGDLDVRLEAQEGKVWVVWEDSSTHLGWCELLSGGAWSAPAYEAVAGTGDEEAARLRIKLHVLRGS